MSMLIIVAAFAAAAALRPRLDPPRTGAPTARPRVPAARTSQLGAADDWARVLDHLAAEVRTGASLAGALGSLAHDDAVIVHALVTAHTVGGPVAATLDGAGSTLRERIALRADARAHSSAARLSAALLTALPVLFAAWMAATSASVRAVWAAPVGVACGGLGVVLNSAGWVWMRRIIRRAAS
ncbi:MAG TPA: type II secretion system F family protein [Ilumatobacteraceae bacterium]|nr:type II secretion system F family protein [Ilumatobacteraceae bacterium]